tara:strand:+ start:284 stop:553 length:270 start_codon:yes stop_codon:yes gene_type:complete
MAKPTLSDSLKTIKGSLQDYLGKDLYGIFESGQVKADAWGIETNIDWRKKNINFQKRFGKDLMFDLDINKISPYSGYRDDIRIGITKKF